MIMIRARGNNILKTSNENISAFRMQPILCSIFLLQIFYWYFSSGLLWLALLSLYKNFRVQGLINFGVVYIESDLILLFFFESHRISNLFQETQTVLCYFIFNNFNDKGFFKKTSVYFRKLFHFLGNFELIFLFFSLFEQTTSAPQPSATLQLTQGCWMPPARERRGASWLRSILILTWRTSLMSPLPPLTLFLTPAMRWIEPATQTDKPGVHSQVFTE